LSMRLGGVSTRSPLNGTGEKRGANNRASVPQKNRGVMLRKSFQRGERIDTGRGLLLYPKKLGPESLSHTKTANRVKEEGSGVMGESCLASLRKKKTQKKNCRNQRGKRGSNFADRYGWGEKTRLAPFDSVKGGMYH